MTNILDRVAQAARRQFDDFTPTTTDEFFALRLAAKLGEPAAARHYADLIAQHSHAQILRAYGHAIQSSTDPARQFHQSLQSIPAKGGDASSGGRLAGIRIERRAIGIAMLSGDHLVHADARQLSVDTDKALETAAAFATRLLEKLQCGSVIVETIPAEKEIQRRQIQQGVINAIREQAIAVTELEALDVLRAYSHPPAQFRRDLRAILSEVYPSLREMPGLPWTQDAAALALYAHTERLFTINESNQ